MMGRPSVTSTTSRYQYHIPPENNGNRFWAGPSKVICFCLLAVILPCVLVSVALLMRFVFNGAAVYHLAPSDMRILDQRISTIWCQSETVKGNTSFTAYVTDGEPEVVKSLAPLVIQRNLIVPDDHKEYWGFYLLKGSTFRIHTCARFKGGTLLVVRGRNHLEHCAYIGEDDSAGDSDEFSSSNSNENPSNLPKSRGGVTDSLPTSQEEMGVILTKIRQYIRSKPRNYSKLKKNLANWMLIEHTRSLEEEAAENATRADAKISQPEIERNKTVSQGGLTIFSTVEHEPRNSSGTVKNIEDDVEVEPKELENGSLFEQGKILRNRRNTEVRKLSESGENGAFEEESPVKIKDEKIPTSTLKPSESSEGRSIWELEHSHHHGVLNDQLNPNDGSNSESESSWSSSEEAMAKCEGVLATFNIKPKDNCGLEATTDGSEWDNDLFYEGYVNASGYYYFIFGSENEKRDNIIRARFELEKFVYNLPQPVDNCTNVKDCKVDFRFGSSQKLVITVPQPPPHLESVWNDNYVAESDCLPRTSLYLIFVLLVPLVILLCAFQ